MASHMQVAHAWMNKTGRSKRGFAMFYEGDTIYSWGKHFPIAHHVTSEGGAPCVLITTREYSRSTAKHVTYTYRATHGMVFEVDNVMATTEQEHLHNYTAMLEVAADHVAKAKRARVWKDGHMQWAQEAFKAATEYAAWFNLSVAASIPGSIGDALADMTQHRHVVNLRAQEEREARQRAQRIEQRRNTNPRMVQWLKGESMGYTFTTLNSTVRYRPFVRVMGDRVQTSWGADVPLDVALTAFRMATKVRKSGKEWVATGLRTLMVGDYALKRIGPSGNLVIGCHDIPYRHQQTAAKLAGIEL